MSHGRIASCQHGLKALMLMPVLKLLCIENQKRIKVNNKEYAFENVFLDWKRRLFIIVKEKMKTCDNVIFDRNFEGCRNF